MISISAYSIGTSSSLIGSAVKLAPKFTVILPYRNVRDYYDILGIDRNATESDIKTAFYVKSKEFHPDKCSNASTAAFVELKNAYDVLRRPADRCSYDRRNDCNNTRQKNTYNYNYHTSYTRFNRQRKPGFEYNKEQEEWMIMWKWIFIGCTMVIMYVIGYVFQIQYREHKLSNLVDESEIARSFLRQPEFKDRNVDSLELESLARILKSDVDEAWRRRREDIMRRNTEEVLEEYRWLRAVQDIGYSRRTNAKLIKRKKYINESGLSTR